MSLVLLVVLIVLLVMVLPHWPYARQWGYYPSGSIGLMLLVLVIVLILFGKF